MRPNIGTLNAYVRITCGLTMLAWSGGKLNGRYDTGRHLLCVMLGAMKVAEGITRFCPLTKMITDSMSRGNESSEEQANTSSVNMYDL
ncbi:YgaP family membrane protein [Alteribacillus iranensis]|uniref:Inner membrane protein YgaP-like transmembrane domain-containing protein n=1 Tax=Alteribacillus iranensis TaxID=930128 RepID=A0A1I2E845_9BACI|nr:DUF2892 domain-containing protein [Alteribacillus iranensis]SFE88873.1 Protein of unknown function [Alteribacillus iranensis]